jgi:type I site-specific restriction endonuclease
MKATTNSLTEFFGEPIDVYTLEQALEDGILTKVGLIQPGSIPVIFTSNLFSEVKDNYKEIIEKGLKMLKQKDKEDTEHMKLRVIEKNKIWVIANSEGVTFMKPEDY